CWRQRCGRPHAGKISLVVGSAKPGDSLDGLCMRFNEPTTERMAGAMQGIDREWIATAVVLLAFMAVPALAAEPTLSVDTGGDTTRLDTATAERLTAVADRGVELDKGGDLPGVATAYDALIADPAFPQVPLELRRMVYSRAAAVALERGDKPKSRDLYLQDRKSTR